MLLLLLLSRVSRVRLFVTPWTASYQAPLSMGVSRQEYWSGVPLPSPLIPSAAAAAAAKSLQSCPTLCDPTDGSPPGFPVPGILQARTLEWVAISFYTCPLDPLAGPRAGSSKPFLVLHSPSAKGGCEESTVPMSPYAHNMPFSSLPVPARHSSPSPHQPH